MIQLVDHPIDSAALVSAAQQEEAGAVLLFLGTTRKFTGDRQTLELNYDAYREMAERELARLEAQARQRWALVECMVVHRLGPVPLGEASVAIVVSSRHRDAAFEAGRWLIDTLKVRVPIWKQEHYADGSVEWVHPSTASAATTAPLDKSGAMLRATTE